MSINGSSIKWQSELTSESIDHSFDVFRKAKHFRCSLGNRKIWMGKTLGISIRESDAQLPKP
jgi:hypothetical protein